MNKREWKQIVGSYIHRIAVEKDGIQFDLEEIRDDDQPWIAGAFLTWNKLWDAHVADMQP